MWSRSYQVEELVRVRVVHVHPEQQKIDLVEAAAAE
jgi:hypothetical protein